MNRPKSLSKLTRSVMQIITVGLYTAILAGCIGPDKDHDNIKFNQITTRLEQQGFKGIIAIQTSRASYLAGIGDKTTVTGLADESTLVDIGSITKSITAAAILLLAQEKRLSVTDPLSKFIQNVPLDKSEITVHQLLTHSSGLLDTVGDDHEYGLTKEVFLKRALGTKLKSEPGTNYNYSNVGYSLLAAIIEQVSGLPYEHYLRHELLKNAQLPSIGYAATYDPKKSMLTETGEDIAAGSWGGKPNWALIGNGGLIATAPDMIRFQQKFKAGEILSSAFVKLAQMPHMRESANAPSDYGYGTVVEDHSRFGRIYWHNGSNGKFHANLTTYADKDLIVFTASNTPTFNADKAEQLIANIFLN